MKQEMSAVGKEMLLFRENLAREYGYKPILVDFWIGSFIGDVREMYRGALPEWCLDETGHGRPLYTLDGTQISYGYTRVVIGDYGAFVEISPDEICSNAIACKQGQEYRFKDERYANHVKYLWLTAKDGSDCKIYLQKKTVDYADYVPGMYYISPYEVFPEK